MLLPNIYWESAPVRQYPHCAGLKGEIAIFLALVAFAMVPEAMPHVLPTMFRNGQWQTYGMPDGRKLNTFVG
jgi:hypothetical protein